MGELQSRSCSFGFCLGQLQKDANPTTCLFLLLRCVPPPFMALKQTPRHLREPRVLKKEKQQRALVALACFEEAHGVLRFSSLDCDVRSYSELQLDNCASASRKSPRVGEDKRLDHLARSGCLEVRLKGSTG